MAYSTSDDLRVIVEENLKAMDTQSQQKSLQ